MLGTLGFGGVLSPVVAAPTLRQKLKQTNNKRYYIQQKKHQTDLKLKTKKKALICSF